MMGILPDIARSLGVSIPEAGHLISAYALGVCFGAPLMVLVARKRPLKQILLALTAMIAAGNLCASLAPDYWSLLGLRFVSGLPHGAFFGVGSIVAERVADAGKRTEAVSIMIVGMTVANLFGVPLGTYISNVLTWRATFGIVAVWGVVALLLVRLWVPRMEPLPDTGLKGQFRFLLQSRAVARAVVGDAGQRRHFLLVQLRQPADDSRFGIHGGRPDADHYARRVRHVRGQYHRRPFFRSFYA